MKTPLPGKLNRIFSLAAIGSLGFLALGLHNIENYLDWGRFLLALLIPGAIFGSLVNAVLCFFIPEIKTYKNDNGIRLLVPLVFYFALIFFGTGALINEYSAAETECRDYVIESTGESSAKKRKSYVFIQTGNKTERLSFGKAFNKAHQPGETVNLCLVTGRLGFRYYRLNDKDF